MIVHQKIENIITIQSINSTSVYTAKRIESKVSNRCLNVMCVPDNIICDSQKVKMTPCPPVDEWIKKMCYIHKMEYHTAIKNVLIHANTIDEPWKHYAK